MKGDYLQVYPAADGFRWRLRAGNHETIATGEAHRDTRDATRAALRACGWTAESLWVLPTRDATRGGELHAVRVLPEADSGPLQEFLAGQDLAVTRCTSHVGCMRIGEEHFSVGAWIVRAGTTFRVVPTSVDATTVREDWPSLGLLVEHAAKGRKAVYANNSQRLVGALDAALAIAEEISGDQVIRVYRANGRQLLDFSGGGVLRLADPFHGGLRRMSVDVVAVEGPAADDARVREEAYAAVIASPVGEVILP